MTPETNKSIVDKIIDRILYTSDFTPESNLEVDLGCDTLDSVELLMEIEDSFIISISNEEWNEVKTVQDIYNIVDAKTITNDTKTD